jgi:hypothetical protein
MFVNRTQLMNVTVACVQFPSTKEKSRDEQHVVGATIITVFIRTMFLQHSVSERGQH